ncbi:hypothetical protein AMS68_005959 [Peltaster fructicola]|uniref:Uncharacterized protein n=1 Tax=Peltaster fructicola TaxID=286661 RepID=A0A6H0Y082_9PEZI|nr:hypothetical protein AMS68_005959 [Peltaster fructicola]
MADSSLVTDPALLSVLAAASKAREQSSAILDLLERYHNASTGDSIEQASELAKQQKLLNAQLSQLRGLNRKAVLSVRRTKQETTEARQEIDSLHLQLQNLYYEQRHLKGEILACEEYNHKYRQLSMIPKEEYIQAHSDSAELNDHELTIARIEDEHAARQALEEQRAALQQRKDALTIETNAKKDELAKLDTDIEKWLHGETDIRKVFETRDKKNAEATV